MQNDLWCGEEGWKTAINENNDKMEAQNRYWAVPIWTQRIDRLAIQRRRNTQDKIKMLARITNSLRHPFSGVG